MTGLIVPVSIAAMVIAAIALLTIALVPSASNRQRKELTKTVHAYASANYGSRTEARTSTLKRLRNSGASTTANLLAKRGYTPRLRNGLQAAGLTMRPEEFVLLCVGGSIGIGALFFLLSSGSLPAAVLGAAVGIAPPTLILRFKTSRRQLSFLDDLPDALTALASGLSAGASLTQAIDGVAEESTGAMGDELSRAIIETRLGKSVAEALDAVSIRMHCDDLGMVVMAIRLQTAHGGNLGELLTTVSATLRERVQMQRHVRALSAEGRISLMVLMALPCVVLLAMAVIRRQYFDFFVTTMYGWMALGACGVLMLCGYLWARSIVRVEV